MVVSHQLAGYRPLNWEPRIACKRGEAELAARRYGAGGGGSGPPRRGVATAGAVRQWLSYSGVALRSLSHSRTIVRASAPLWKSVATWRTKWMRRPPFERHAAASTPPPGHIAPLWWRRRRRCCFCCMLSYYYVVLYSAATDTHQLRELPALLYVHMVSIAWFCSETGKWPCSRLRDAGDAEAPQLNSGPFLLEFFENKETYGLSCLTKLFSALHWQKWLCSRCLRTWTTFLEMVITNYYMSFKFQNRIMAIFCFLKVIMNKNDCHDFCSIL